jgi:hypothetical protein
VQGGVKPSEFRVLAFRNRCEADIISFLLSSS